VISVLVVLVLALLLFIVYYLSTNKNPFQQGGTCQYNGQTYQFDASFKSEDGCNTCSCTNNGVICTLMACVSGVPEITGTVVPSDSPAVAVTTTPAVLATVTPVAGTFKVYYGKPSAENDYNTLGAAERNPTETGVQLYSYGINQVVTGPNATEKASGLVPVMSLSGASSCGGSSFKFDRSGTTLTVRFCKDMNFTANTGTGGAYAGMGLAASGRVVKALRETLMIDGVTKVIVRQKDGTCFSPDSGANPDCT
jgi:hypothetical protein